MLVADRARVVRASHFIGLFAVALTFAFVPAALAAPSNDDFAAAVDLPTELPVPAPSGNVEATKEPGEPDHAGDPGGHSVWFTWTPTTSGPVDISTTSCFFGSFDTTLAVYTGSAVDGLTFVGANDDTAPTFPCANTNSKVELMAVAGTTYRIAVDGVSGATGSFGLRIDGAPENDDFADAVALNPGHSTQAGGTTKYAGTQAGEPSHAGSPGGHSVWFTWTPASSGRVELSATTCFSRVGLDTLLAVYTGSSLGGLTPVVSSDDDESACESTDSVVEFKAIAGTTYRIAVDGKDGSTGEFRLFLDGAPANDDFSQPTVIGPNLPAPGQGATLHATKQPGEPNHAGSSGGGSLWYSWTPSISGPIEISTCTSNGESGTDTLLAVYTGSSVDSLTPVASNDDGTTGCYAADSTVQFTAIADTTYRIAVDTKAGKRGPFSFDLVAPAENDAFAGAKALESALPAFGSGNSSFATKEPGEPAHAGHAGGHSVWFTWTPSSSGPVQISTTTCLGALDTVLAVYTGSSVGGLTPVASNDDGDDAGCKTTDSRVEFTAVADTTYRIAVDGKAGSKGDFGLTVEGAPANDAFDLPFVLSQPSYGSPGNSLATKENGEPDHAGNPGGHSVWYSWTAGGNHGVEISICTNRSSSFDSLLAVYTGSSVDNLTPVVSNDDDEEGCEATDSAVRFTASAGTTYRVAVDGRDGDIGSYMISVRGVAANDDLTKAEPLASVLPGGGSGSNRFATKQGGEPDHAGDPGGASVWFKWTAPRSGPVNLDTCESKFDTLLAVYTGSSPAGLAPVASNDDANGSCGTRSRLSFDAIANTTYKIAVDGAGGAQGRIGMRIDPPASGDDFNNARPIRGKLPRSAGDSTVFASKEPGEPSHAGDPGGHSVWFAWTADSGGTIRLSTCSEDMDTLLAVYTGSSVAGLAPLASNDDGTSFCGPGSTLDFEATAGVTYRIAVDGAGGDVGHFWLYAERLSTTPVPGGGGDEGEGPTVDPPPDAPPVALASPAPVTSPPARPKPPKPLKCKPGFKKKSVRGKTKCVKKKKKKGVGRRLGKAGR